MHFTNTSLTTSSRSRKPCKIASSSLVGESRAGEAATEDGRSLKAREGKLEITSYNDLICRNNNYPVTPLYEFLLRENCVSKKVFYNDLRVRN